MPLLLALDTATEAVGVGVASLEQLRDHRTRE